MPFSGCWSAEIACRRACRSPRLASVISFSSSGLTALALASVVLIRSWSMTSTHRFASSALRCAASRESLWRVFWWRMAELVLAQRQPALRERLDHLVDRLLAEVGDRRQLALGLRHQVADGLDARALGEFEGAPPHPHPPDRDAALGRPPAPPGRAPADGRARAAAVVE